MNNTEKRLHEAERLIGRIIAAYDSRPSMAPVIYQARAFIGQPVNAASKAWADRKTPPDSERIQQLARVNDVVRKALAYHRFQGVSYEEALEAAVIVLVDQLTTTREALIRAKTSSRR